MRAVTIRPVLPVLLVVVSCLVAAPARADAGPADTSLVVGIQGRYLTSDEIAELFNVEVPGGGVLVERVVEDSPAARAGLHGGELQATIQGDSILLGGDLITQLEVHKVCAGACLMDAPTELTRLGWVGVTYLRKGRARRTVIEISDHAMDPVNPPPPLVEPAP